MKIQSVDMISRYTQASSRNLLLLSGGVLLVMHYELNSQVWSFADRELQPNEFKEIATVVLVFSLVAHVVHWVSDYISYTKWFQSNAIPTDSIDALGSFRNSTQCMTAGLVVRAQRLTELSEKIDEVVVSPNDLAPQGDSTPEAIYENINRQRRGVRDINGFVSQLENQISEIDAVLRNIGPGFKSISGVSKFVIYVWYFAIPLVAFLWAVRSLWC